MDVLRVENIVFRGDWLQKPGHRWLQFMSGAREAYTIFCFCEHALWLNKYFENSIRHLLSSDQNAIINYALSG